MFTNFIDGNERFDFTEHFSFLCGNNFCCFVSADTVVCTLPLGVLQSGDVEFEPELEPWKHTAMHRLGMGLLNKVCVYRVIKRGFENDNFSSSPRDFRIFQPKLRVIMLACVCRSFWSFRQCFGR